MKLRLTLIQGPPSQGGDLTRDLGTGRLVIGRGVECDWALSDPERALSKTHCMVEFKGGVYVVIDSSTNGVFLNDAGAPIGRGNSAVIGDGDRLRLGGYVIRAGFAADEAPPANDPFLAVLRSGDTPAASGGFGGPPAADDPLRAVLRARRRADDADPRGRRPVRRTRAARRRRLGQRRWRQRLGRGRGEAAPGSRPPPATRRRRPGPRPVRWISPPTTSARCGWRPTAPAFPTTGSTSR
ncbi:type VI secretion system-associated FHA domain protein [Azospirillum doebereinerae]|uniref:type VI secretion system-associated FHA domain protein n=1 Tax=Azospirillum doebereinerae TaxID=92933 RepID=UPI00385112B9